MVESKDGSAGNYFLFYLIIFDNLFLPWYRCATFNSVSIVTFYALICQIFLIIAGLMPLILTSLSSSS